MAAKMKQLNRSRVLEFEDEASSKLLELATVERDLLQIESLRTKWLSYISSASSNSTEMFQKRLKALKLQSELSALNMTIDTMRMESVYELQKLNYLITVTGAKSHSAESSEEHILEQKEALLKQARRDTDNLRVNLQKSLEYRRGLRQWNGSLCEQMKALREAQITSNAQTIEEIREKIMAFIQKNQASLGISHRNRQRVTAEYLVLRHNARVAREILTRSENEARHAREELQSCLQSVLDNAKAQRDKLEVASQAELKLMTSDVRAHVIRKEQYYENLREETVKLKNARKMSMKAIREDTEEYERKYSGLQRKRREDMLLVAEELKGLREAIQSVEVKLRHPKTYVEGIENVDNSVTSYDSQIQYREEEAQSPRDFLRQIQSRFQELQRITT